MSMKMYILVRKDLTHGVIQGSHALALYALEHPAEFQAWHNSTIVFLGVFNLKALREWNVKLAKAGKIYSFFREPDLDNQETSIACYDDGKIFEDLRII